MHLAISRARKVELISQYKGMLDASNGFIIVKYGGLSVPEVDGLRNAVREAEGKYMVTKNTLFTKTLQDNGWAVPDDLLNGPVAVAFGMENFPGVAKAVLEYTDQKEFAEKFGIRGGVMGEEILNAQGVETISKLPTLDELRAQLAGLMVSPAQGLVNVVYAATGQVVNVLQAYLDDRGEGDGDAA